MTYQNRVYLRGLVSAGIGGAANAVTLLVIDPLSFNIFQGGALKLATAMAVSSLVSFAIYVKEHPLPNPDVDNNYQSVVNQKIAELKGTGDGK